jgi:hypothetical protein
MKKLNLEKIVLLIAALLSSFLFFKKLPNLDWEASVSLGVAVICTGLLFVNSKKNDTN